MKSLFVASVFALLLAPPLMGHPVSDEQTASAEQHIRQLLGAWDAAVGQRDVQRLGRMLADTFTLTDASGSVLTKSAYLESIVKTPDFARVASYASEDVVVQVDGDTAVVTGRSPVKGRPRGKAQAARATYLFTDAWVKTDGAWKAVSTHAALDRSIATRHN